MNLGKLFPLAFLASFAPACAVQPADAPAAHEEVGAAAEADTETGFNDMTLNAGDTSYSYDGRTYLIMQADGNLVLYFAPFGKSAWSHALWASNTYGHPGAYAVMQADGNLVVYGPTTCITVGSQKLCGHPVLWASNTSNTSGAWMNSASVQNDGNFVIYDGNGKALWATGTNYDVPPQSMCINEPSNNAYFCPAGSWWHSCEAPSYNPSYAVNGTGDPNIVVECKQKCGIGCLYAGWTENDLCQGGSRGVQSCTNNDGTLSCNISDTCTYTGQ